MKNNKVAIVALLIFIAGIWVLILQRFFNFFNSESNPAFESSFVAPVLSKTSMDTFSISGSYRDPFLGQVKMVSDGNKPKVAPAPKVAPVALKWPVILYGGMIKNKKSNAQLCMVNINGQSNFMKVGDKVSDLELKNIYKDSIEVVFEKEIRMVKK